MKMLHNAGDIDTQVSFSNMKLQKRQTVNKINIQI